VCVGAASDGAGRITLLYYTGWSPCFIHYTTGNWKVWNDVPGRPLQPSSTPGYPSPAWSQVTLEATNVTFVLTNGHGGWDNNGGRNYRVRCVALRDRKVRFVPCLTFVPCATGGFVWHVHSKGRDCDDVANVSTRNFSSHVSFHVPEQLEGG